MLLKIFVMTVTKFWFTLTFIHQAHTLKIQVQNHNKISNKTFYSNFPLLLIQWTSFILLIVRRHFCLCIPSVNPLLLFSNEHFIFETWGRKEIPNIALNFVNQYFIACAIRQCQSLFPVIRVEFLYLIYKYIWLALLIWWGRLPCLKPDLYFVT